MFISLPPVLLRSACLAAWCAVQCSRRCCTVSSLCLQPGQSGESIFPIRCKCLASGACPVLSCDRILAIFRGRSVMRSIYLRDGVVGSVFFIRSYRSDFCHAFCALRFSFSLYAHFIADLLCGRAFLSILGSSDVLLLPSVIAFFACSSANSLPSTPLCPGIHCMVMHILTCFFHSSSMLSCRASNI